MLGFSGIQRHRLPCHREPASSMYGRTRASEGAAQHSQLPPGADEEGCHTAREEGQEEELRLVKGEKRERHQCTLEQRILGAVQ